MRRRIAILLTCLCLAAPAAVRAQEYTQTPVTLSKEKVRSGGKVYWSHVVQERQTLFAIARAYGVTVDEICAANPDANLREEGLKLNAIILVPVSSSLPSHEVEMPQTEAETGPQEPSDNDIVHVVKWYEDIDDIARKYNLPAETILSYNGLTSRKLKTRMKLRIPRVPVVASSAEPAAPESAATDTTVTETAAADSSHSHLEDILSIFRKKEQVKALLILPFGANTSPGEIAMDFYAGFLLGTQELGRDGINIDLSVYDLVSGALPVTADKLRESDLVFGPISPADIRKVMSINTSYTPLVSPLDPRTADMTADDTALIHAPAPADIQYEDLIRWIGQDMVPGDKVLLISESGGKNAETTALADSLLTGAGIAHSAFSYNILAGRRVSDDLLQLAAQQGTTRVLITSDSEAFVHDVVRNLNLLKTKKKDVVLYGVSKIRSFSTIEVENLHKLNLHACVSYFIDYDDTRVRDFVRAYRALYNAEPSQSAFQGHDVAAFFIRACYDGGNRWTHRLATMDRVRMLQTDFLLSQVEEGGWINGAVRRVVYTPDYKITLQQ